MWKAGPLVLLCCCTVAVPFTARQPSLTVITNSSSFSCSDEYLVVGEDFVTFELDLSENNSDYTYEFFDAPTFRFFTSKIEGWKITQDHDYPICEPFDKPENGFCVKRDITNTTGCSCEVVDPQVYRVKAVYRIENVSESRGRVQLIWPSVKAGDIAVSYYVPEVRESCQQDASNPEASSSCSGWCLWGSISIAFIVIFTIIAISLAAHYFGYVDIRCYHRFLKQRNSKDGEDKPSGNLTERKPTMMINQSQESANVRQSEDNHGVSMDEM